MIRIFKNLRLSFINKNSTWNYFKYAVGEIILVMIGILLALQVNNANVKRIEKNKEIKYLNNIRIDLEKDITSLAYNISVREKRIVAMRQIMAQIDGAPLNDLDQTAKNVIWCLYEEWFNPSNVTVKDLLGSGNMNLITNDSIKELLFELELAYQTNKSYIDHETFDYREYISKPIFSLCDVEQIRPVFTDGKTAEGQQLTRESFIPLMENNAFKNGCSIIIWASTDFISIYHQIDSISQQVIALIDAELK